MKHILLAFLLTFPILSYAEVGGEFRGKMYHDIGNDEKVLDKKNLTVLGLTLWDADIPNAQEKIGKTSIEESGVGSGHYGQLCYKGENSVLLLEFPYQSSPPRNLQTVILSRNTHIPEIYAHCTANPKINKDLTFAGGLRLGMSRAEVQKIWGKPGKTTPKVMIYEIRRIEKEYFTDDVSIYLEFRNDHLTYADVSRTAIE
jgi:hypothetical protein